MSLKGLGKSLTRAPQQVRQRFNIGEVTKDAVYIDAERRFEELEKETKKLHDESRKYFNAINSMLDHQIEYARSVKEIYKPISGRVSDPDSFEDEGNQAGIEACEQYEEVVQELKQTIAPELEMIEQRVIAPADELLVVIKAVRKLTQKRDHKQLDYDRHRASLKKLQDKKDKSYKDEKEIYKAEANVEQATQDFEYFNDLLKNELPMLFKLEREFIQPLFQSFYYMQLNVFYTLHERMQNMDIGYFDLSLDIEAAFSKKQGEVPEQIEALSIVRFKTSGQRRPGASSSAPAGASKYGVNKYKKEDEAGAGSPGPSEAEGGYEAPPPPYSTKPTFGGNGDTSAAAASSSSTSHFSNGLSPNHLQSAATSAVAGGIGRANSTGSSGGVSNGVGMLAAAAKAKGAAPPPPKPKPKKFQAAGAAANPTATALYDYEAQADGDLSFSAGDVIEVTVKGKTENEWWTGKLRGREGQFPGNYVQLN